MQLDRIAGISREAGFLDGHFDANPIVPGAVLLGYAVAPLRERGYEIVQFARVKFLGQLPPGIPFEIEFEPGEALSRLRWVAAGRLLAEARVELRQAVD